MQIGDALQDLMTPLFDDLELWLAHLFEVLAQTAAGDNLGDEMNLFFLLANPGADERDDVRMVQFLDNFYF